MHIYANEDYFRIFGFENPDDLVGVPLLDLIDPEFADEFRARIREYRGDGDQASFAFRGRTLDGAPVAGQMTLSAAEYEGERCTQVLLKCAPAALAAPAPVPPPTTAVALDEVPVLTTRAEDVVAPPVDTVANGAQPPANVAGFYEAIRGAADPIGAVCVLEIDDFDALQAEHGLDAVDHVVEEVADCIRAKAGAAILQRIANHRFALATAGASEAGSAIVAEEIREAVESALFEVNGRTVRRTVTVGAATVEGAEKVRDALNEAFRALYTTRAAGRSNCVAWPLPVENAGEDESGLTAEQKRILKLVTEAIEKNTFVLLFQPIISLRGDAEEHYEVFLRLLDDKGRRLPPDQFLELAIANGVAGKIDRWVILQSIKMLSAHRSKGHNTRITINLTKNSLTDPEFIHWLGVAIKAARLPSDAVIFQIAEPDVTAHIRQAKDFVQGLKALHCRTSLRHFGTTENPFDALKHVSVELVKLDGRHVHDLERDTGKREELTAMIRKLQAMGKLTVIPMVESATVLSALWQAGANYIQGHYLQEPSTEMNYDFRADD
jgi:diguanylate cyclase (GGDEF)-like protein